MGDRVRIFNRSGYWLAQVRTSAERTWTWVTETSAVFALSIYDDNCNPFILNYGNWVVIENSDGLPVFVGMIDGVSFDRGAAIVTCFTPERQFFYRRGPESWTISGSAGEVFATIIDYINTVEDTVLEVGEINSRVYLQETLNPVDLTTNLKRIVSRSGEGYRWRPEVDLGVLTIFCDWFPSMVLETGLILHDGRNITGDHPLKGNPPVNDVLVYGNGTNWETRLKSFAVDEDSQNQYGLRQFSKNIQTPSQDTLDETAKTYIDALSQPQYSFPLSALNFNDTFSRLQPGALSTLTKLVGQGFSEDGTGFVSETIVIQSMNYNPATGVVGLSGVNLRER